MATPSHTNEVKRFKQESTDKTNRRTLPSYAVDNYLHCKTELNVRILYTVVMNACEKREEMALRTGEYIAPLPAILSAWDTLDKPKLPNTTWVCMGV